MTRAGATLAVAACLVAGQAFAKDRPRPLDPSAPDACPQYGPGFVAVPGTATCIRIGGRVRADYGATSRRRTMSRDEIAGYGPSGFGSSASVSADVRTETGAGPLRAYVRTRAGGGPYGGR